MKKYIYRALMLVCVIVFCVSAWQLYQIWQKESQIRNETGQLEEYIQTDPNADDQSDAVDSSDSPLVIDWAGLQAQNPDICAWVIVPDTGISYPVVQGADNTWYLNHTALNQSNYMGAIFLDSGANRDFSNDNSLIYGHSVDIGGMFTSLDKFEDLHFFETHPEFWILTPQTTYRCEIIAFSRVNDTAAVYTTSFGDYKNDVLETIASQALYTRVDPYAGQYPLVSLSTCDLDYGFNSDQRLVLTGVMVPQEQSNQSQA